ISGGVLAEVGTMKRTVLAGKDGAAARRDALPARPIATAPVRIARRSMTPSGQRLALGHVLANQFRAILQRFGLRQSCRDAIPGQNSAWNRPVKTCAGPRSAL